MSDEIEAIRRTLRVQEIDVDHAVVRLGRLGHGRSASNECDPFVLTPIISGIMVIAISLFTKDAASHAWVTSWWNGPWLVALALVGLAHVWLSAQRRALVLRPGAGEALVLQGASTIRLPVTGLWMDERGITFQLDGVPIILRHRRFTRHERRVRALWALQASIPTVGPDELSTPGQQQGPVRFPSGVRAMLLKNLEVVSLEAAHLCLRARFSAGLGWNQKGTIAYRILGLSCAIGSILVDGAAPVFGICWWWPRPVAVVTAILALWWVRRRLHSNVTIVPGTGVRIEGFREKRSYSASECRVTVADETSIGDAPPTIQLQTPSRNLILHVGQYGDPLAWHAEHLDKYLHGAYGTVTETR